MDLDPVIADRSNDGLGDAESIDTGFDDFDGLLELLLALVLVDVFTGDVDGLKGEGNSASEIQAGLQAALGTAEQFGQQDVVPLFDVPQGLLESHLREILRQIELPLLADLLQRDEFARGLKALFPRGGLLKELGELRRLRLGVGTNVVHEGLVLEGNQLRDRPHQDGEAGHELPQVAFEHVRLG